MKYYRYVGYDQSQPRRINEVDYSKLSYFERKNYSEVEEPTSSFIEEVVVGMVIETIVDDIFNSSMDNSNPTENIQLDDFNGFGGGDFGAGGAEGEY